MPTPFAALVVRLGVLAAGIAAAAQAPAAPPQSDADHFIHVRYPRDKERTVALVDGLPITLEDLVRHIEERHQPGFRRFLSGPDDAGTPDGARMLASDLIAPWVRQLADVTALQRDARKHGLDEAAAAQTLSAALKAGFAQFLERYVADLKSRGLPAELEQQRTSRLLADYQLRQGLGCELQGWLDLLVPDVQSSERELNEFFQANVRIFGGAVNIAHILVQNRDAGTGIMLGDEGRARAAARLSEVQARLAREGSDFATIARQFSEDSITAPDGGVLQNVERFDYRLPAAICRAAWQLQDGQVSDVIETQYGWHIVKRLELVQKKFMLFTPDAMPTVRTLKRRQEQEDLLFGARKRHAIELRL